MSFGYKMHALLDILNMRIRQEEQDRIANGRPLVAQAPIRVNFYDAVQKVFWYMATNNKNAVLGR